MPDTNDIVLRNSVTRLAPGDRGRIAITGSHGGLYAGYCAARSGARAVVFNDAGIGLGEAGIAGLSYLDDAGIAAVAVSYLSARIGSAEDTLHHGRVSFVNSHASALGCEVGRDLNGVLAHLAKARSPDGAPPPVPPPVKEGRAQLHTECRSARQRDVWLLDSGALVRSQDDGAVLVIGSHGGNPGETQADALKADAFLAIFNDAGVGKDRAGISRLAALEARGIAAATVDAQTARIGNARSSHDKGVLSFCNRPARALGLVSGQSCADAVRTARILI